MTFISGTEPMSRMIVSRAAAILLVISLLPGTRLRPRKNGLRPERWRERFIVSPIHRHRAAKLRWRIFWQLGRPPCPPSPCRHNPHHVRSPARNFQRRRTSRHSVSPRRPPDIYMSAGRGPPCSTGCSPAIAAADTCCESRTPTSRAARRRPSINCSRTSAGLA